MPDTPSLPAEDAPEKPVLELVRLSLNDLAPRLLRAELPIVGEDGTERMVLFEMVALTAHEWYEIAGEIPYPTPPNKIEDGKVVANPDDEDHRREIADVNRRRETWRVIRALQKAGNLPELLDQRPERQIEIFEHFVDQGVVFDLHNLLAAARLVNMARITARAQSFRPVQANGHDHPAAAGLDGGAVAGTAGNGQGRGTGVGAEPAAEAVADAAPDED